MKFLRNNWFKLGLILFVVLSYYMIFWGNDFFSEIQKILCASLMALPLHQFEEYQLPGGGPVVINRYFYGEEEIYTHYPGNWNSTMIVNLSAYIFYILSLDFPQFIWLGLATMFFNLYQVLGHSLQMNIKMKTWYNPGMATSIFLFLPISIYYIYFIVSQNLVCATDWVGAIVMFIVIAILTVILPVQGLKDKNSPFDVPKWQVDQLEKVRKFASISKK